MPLTLQITDVGRAALVNAGHDGTNAVRVASVGVSPTAIVAAPGTAALPGELKRIATIAGDAVAEDVLHMVVRDESADSYTLRSFALYLEDGTLFAAYGQADPIMEKSAQALLLLAVDVALTDVSAAQVTFGDSDFLNPPATVDRQGVVELATEVEATAGTDTQRAVTPKGLLGAIMARLTAWGSDIWRASNDGAGSGLDADLLDGRQAAEFALLSGANFQGGVTTKGFASTAANPGAGGWYIGASVLAPTYPMLRIGGTTGGKYGSIGLGDDGDLKFFVSGTNGVVGTTAMTLGPTGVLSAIGLQVNGNNVWHVANDGSGSGLDADMLDGHHASEFALLSGATFTGPIFGTGISLSQGITAPMGFYLSATSYFGKPTPTLVDYTPDSGDTMRFDQDANQWDWYIDSTNKLSIRPTTVVISDALTVGGSVSARGLSIPGDVNATLTIGRFSAANPNSIINVPADVATLLVQFAGNIAFRVKAGGIDTPGSFNSGGAIMQNGSQVWHVANDGSGSGMDADMVDGWHRDDIRNWNNLLAKPGSFPPSAHTHSAAEIAGAFPSLGAPNGYLILPSGLILQWGKIRASYANEALIGVAFPTTFPNACLNAQATGYISSTSTARDLWPQICGEPSTSGMAVQLQSDDNDNWSLQGFNWWAVGY